MKRFEPVASIERVHQMYLDAKAEQFELSTPRPAYSSCWLPSESTSPQISVELKRKSLSAVRGGAPPMPSALFVSFETALNLDRKSDGSRCQTSPEFIFSRSSDFSQPPALVSVAFISQVPKAELVVWNVKPTRPEPHMHAAAMRSLPGLGEGYAGGIVIEATVIGIRLDVPVGAIESQFSRHIEHVPEISAVRKIARRQFE